MAPTSEEPKFSKRHRLSDTYLEQQTPPPPGKRMTIWDTTPGFAARLTDKGHISFFVMRRRAGERKASPIRIVLGGYPKLSVEAARKQAKALLDELENGTDPRERERQQRQAKEAQRTNTFRATADAFHYLRLQHWARGYEHWRTIERELIWPKNKKASWSERPLLSITADDVQERIEALRDLGKKEAARRLFEIVRALFHWAKAQRRYKLKELPTDDINIAALIGAKPKRKRVLTNDELTALWRASDRLAYPVGPYVRVLILTAVRRSEAAEARWDEVTILGAHDDAWTIPAERMKSDSPHVVPIASDLASVLSGLPRFETGPFLFSTTGGRRPIAGHSKIKERSTA
jgi:integrase